MEIEEGSASTCLMVWDTASDWSKSNFSSTTHAVDGLIDPNPNQIPVREIGWHTCIFMKSCWKPLVSLMSGLKIRDAIPQQKCIFSTLFSFLSRSTWVKTEILDIVLKHETDGKNLVLKIEIVRKILILVSKHETKRKKFSIFEAWEWKEEILDLISRVERGLSLCPDAS